jgi:Ca2+-binding EF-hand superfamily protein
MSDKLKEAFFNFDADMDGYLTTEELRFILGSVGERLPESEVLFSK